MQRLRVERDAATMRKAITIILLAFLMGSMTSAFEIRAARADGPIYIRADGSIDPSTAPITTVDNITYTLTANITSDADGIVIERDNITLDGAGCMLQCARAHWGYGIVIEGRVNITVKSIELKAYWNGIRLAGSLNNTLSANTITDNWYGIVVYNSRNNNIAGNNIATSEFADIWVAGSDNNTFFENNIRPGGYGILMVYSSDNKFYHNNFIDSGVSIPPQFSRANVWDDGYPSGGNYWSDYGGVDQKSGPYQNLTGSDGIGARACICHNSSTSRVRHFLRQIIATATATAAPPAPTPM